MVWAEVIRISTEACLYETRHGAPISLPLLAFVNDDIYLSRIHEGRQVLLNITSFGFTIC